MNVLTNQIKLKKTVVFKFSNKKKLNQFSTDPTTSSATTITTTGTFFS